MQLYFETFDIFSIAVALSESGKKAAGASLKVSRLDEQAGKRVARCAF